MVELKCSLCDTGFPLIGENHIPTQSLGMIPVTRCQKLPPLKTGAGMARHRSHQDYSTPDDFIAAVQNRFGKISFDLAADKQNKKAPSFYSIEEDSLKQDWHSLSGLLWLNPPFSDIAPWAEKCDIESNLGARILFLTPASVGSNWFANHVHRRARVYAIRPRLSFYGTNPYPKDVILSYYSVGTPTTFETWKWKPC